MRIFLSHASEVTAIAETIELALGGEGHEVFLDRSDLQSGETYNDRIRDAVVQSDLFIFLISPEALAPGRYTLTELEFARNAWRHPSGRVLPVIVKPTALDLVPAYLKAVTFLEPQGNIGAAVAAAVARMGTPWYRSSRALTAAVVIVLIAASAAGWWGVKRRAVGAEVSALLESGQLAQRSGKYPAAWEVYARADALGPRRRDVAVAMERLAMEWLGNMRVTAGKGSFTSIADTVEPVLAACAQSTERERAADCRAHIGWADFLRTREGVGGLSPVRHYEQALELDPDNVYAHTMWSFDIHRTRGSMELAREHLSAALKSGRERTYVRHLQISGLLWRRDPEAETALVRVANEMRTHEVPLQTDPVISADRWRLWNVYYDRLLNGSDEEGFVRALSPGDHLATFHWLFPLAEIPNDKRNLYSFMLAGFQERAGDRASALATYRSLRDVLVREGAVAHGGPLPDRTVAAVQRLSK